MARQDSIRSKLAAKIFNTTTGIGKTVTLKSIVPGTYNTRGELETSTVNSSSIVIVPYDQVTTRSIERLGELGVGELEAAVPYTVTIAINDKITMEGSDWLVIAVLPNWLPDNVVTIVRLRKVLA
jgi:hypothetical protein